MRFQITAILNHCNCIVDKKGQCTLQLESKVVASQLMHQLCKSVLTRGVTQWYFVILYFVFVLRVVSILCALKFCASQSTN